MRRGLIFTFRELKDKITRTDWNSEGLSGSDTSVIHVVRVLELVLAKEVDPKISSDHNLRAGMRQEVDDQLFERAMASPQKGVRSKFGEAKIDQFKQLKPSPNRSELTHVLT